MKKAVLMGVFALLIGFSSFARTGEEVSEQVLQSFNREFAGAQDVNWEISKTMQKATFKLNGQTMFAYYEERGELLALTRNITSSQLPITLLSNLKKSYSEFWITDLFEISSEGNTQYFITIQSADQTVVLKSDNSYGWQTYKKVKTS
ncbi:hypothetical protein HHL16_02755 [Pseudoflavitalea sp. G-6-1-2]|uniref:hypothetical protein n=1 Tax=Pseudoflavitalea sp. G-6-1-2 TaxID=2728841 RepID=UPI00146DB7C0|nr:hypothetical protein [Pseudoflavitalea sp. G-6-1-2]NML19772.1 hypothetical protein [Pseudoflavitalea sp. G-6-1-2]